MQGGSGATGIVVLIVDVAGGVLKSKIAGFAGQQIRQVRSAFHAEVSALDWATEYLAALFVRARAYKRQRCEW